MKKYNNLAIREKREYFIPQPGGGIPWVHRIAWEHWDSSLKIFRDFRDRGMISFILQGTVRISHGNDRWHKAGPGDIMVMAPDTRHWIEVTDTEGLQIILFMVQDQQGADLVKRILPAGKTVLPLADTARVEGLFYRMLEAAEKGGFNNGAIVSTLAAPLLLTIDQEYRSHGSADPVFALFSRCRNYMEHNWQNLTSVAEVPAAMGISQPYLGRLFRRYEHCTPHQFLLKRKMTYALYELHQGHSTIAEIAETLGFSDAYSFSKTFKRIMGKAPSAMR